MTDQDMLAKLVLAVRGYERDPKSWDRWAYLKETTTEAEQWLGTPSS